MTRYLSCFLVPICSAVFALSTVFALGVGGGGTAWAQDTGAGGLDAPAPPSGARIVPPPAASDPLPTDPNPSADAQPLAQPGEIPDVPPPPTSPDAPEADPFADGSSYPLGSGSSTALSEGPQVDSRTATRLRVLEGTYRSLAARGGSRIVDGIVAIGSGALSITLGILFDDDALSTYLYVFGGASIGQGLVALTLSPDASDAALAFEHMPMRTQTEVASRLAFGEEELSSLASQARVARILDASIRIGAGLAVVPLYLGPKDFEIDPFGVIVLIGAGVSVVTGLINMFSSSDLERRWAAYDELRERLSEPQSDLELDLTGFATPESGGLTLTGRF